MLAGIGGGVALSTSNETAGWIFMGAGALIGGTFTIKSILLNNKAIMMEQQMHQRLYSINLFDKEFERGDNLHSFMSICKDDIMNTKTFTLNLSYTF